ncbi:PfkB family carbohydrate kinase [Palleronia abyssalis]|nr:PfkB family carbohydrate kinase [Palleronia abyssalis]
MSAILCIGSVLWDVIGRTPAHMALGSDVPGHIVRIPGGVAMNVAMTFARLGIGCDLLTAVGNDFEGAALLNEARQRGIGCGNVYVSEDLPTDQYMAIEGGNGLVAAIADAHSLEKAGDKILAPLLDGRIATEDDPFSGVAALDGNLSEGLLARIASGPWLARADLRIAPASPGKVLRLVPLLAMANATFYVNLEEAGALLGGPQADARTAAAALAHRGTARVLVTNGGQPAALAEGDSVVDAAPPDVLVTRITGAGDTFMAAHIAAERSGLAGADALASGLRAAAHYVSGDVTT